MPRGFVSRLVLLAASPAVFLVFVLAASAVTLGSNSAVAGAPTVKGDVDCASDIDTVDALKILRHAAGLPVSQGPGCPQIGQTVSGVSTLVTNVFGDMDCDGDVDPVDALDILRHAAALTVSLPSGCPNIGSDLATGATPTTTPTPPPTATPTPQPTLPPVTIQEGWFIEAGDGQFLGVFTCNQFDSDGIFNKFGQYGSRFSSTSIWNAFGQYGGQFGSYSPFYWYADHPIITDGTVFLYLRTIYYPRVTPTDLVMACFSNDPSELAYWLDLIP